MQIFGIFTWIKFYLILVIWVHYLSRRLTRSIIGWYNLGSLLLRFATKDVRIRTGSTYLTSDPSPPKYFKILLWSFSTFLTIRETRLPTHRTGRGFRWRPSQWGTPPCTWWCRCRAPRLSSEGGSLHKTRLWQAKHDSWSQTGNPNKSHLKEKLPLCSSEQE